MIYKNMYLCLSDDTIGVRYDLPAPGWPYVPITRITAEDGMLLTDGVQLRKSVDVNAHEVDRWSEIDEGSAVDPRDAALNILGAQTDEE